MARQPFTERVLSLRLFAWRAACGDCVRVFLRMPTLERADTLGHYASQSIQIGRANIKIIYGEIEYDSSGARYLRRGPCTWCNTYESNKF